ncbi:MFS transporter [Bacillus sp. CGMCC 1.16607]|uniref:MFS transporter n=1 Tax=Bacillus sp. CGMCC 1.16607 TaxID=3351842 RepID=UPI003627D1EB
MSSSSMFAPLKIKSYRNLFFGQIFSDFGGFLDFIALNILIIYTWGHGPAYTAALLVIYSIPMVLIGPFTAVWVDRLPKKMVMVVSDLMRVFIAISLIWAPNVYILFVLVFLKSIFGASFDPARQSMIRHTVPEEYLLQASSLSQILMNSVKIIAPALGSALMLITEVRTLFMIEAAAFALSALFISKLPSLKKERETQKSSFVSEFKAGLSYIRSNRLLFFAIIFLSTGMFTIFLYEALFTPWAKSMGFLKSELGYIMTANGLGAVIGALFVGKWTFWKNSPLHLMLYSGIISGVFVTLFGLGSLEILSLPKLAWITVFFIIGCTAAGAYVPFGYILQKETSSDFMGRVSGASNSLINLAMLIGPVFGGFLATWLGASFVFIGAGLLLSVYASIVLLFIHKILVPQRMEGVKEFV